MSKINWKEIGIWCKLQTRWILSKLIQIIFVQQCLANRKKYKCKKGALWIKRQISYQAKQERKSAEMIHIEKCFTLFAVSRWQDQEMLQLHLSFSHFLLTSIRLLPDLTPHLCYLFLTSVPFWPEPFLTICECIVRWFCTSFEYLYHCNSDHFYN